MSLHVEKGCFVHGQGDALVGRGKLSPQNITQPVLRVLLANSLTVLTTCINDADGDTCKSTNHILHHGRAQVMEINKNNTSFRLEL